MSKNKIALYHCNSDKEISNKIRLIIEALGTKRFEELFKNKKVLLKPNMCIDHIPEKGATTYPTIMDALITIVKEFGGEVIVGDAPAIGVKGNVFEKAGLYEVCKKHGVKLIDFNRDVGKVVVIENAIALKEVLIAKTYFEVDTIVNIPVFKSNSLYWISGALKNMKGLIVGMDKHKPHYLGVPECVADLNGVLEQDFILMDGYIGMMGDGPTAGKPANARLLIGGFDPVSIDSLAARLMGFPVEKIPMIKWAENAGIGNSDYEIIGDSLNSFHLKFDKPAIAKNRLKAALINYGGKYFFREAQNKSKMDIDENKCIMCGRCRDMCPFNAISIEDKKITIDQSKCDFCLCCTEVCKSEAIKLKGMLSRKDAFLR
ncbi:ferredoxin-2 [Clostridium homopropionicum DSM 5847]|uniref:Ferredoxin-2 n=1 Tax=Clostridium homopropionicum DSM 5847 TaxID=1121318 RepID=A0A0L6Z9R6_9CLOT|nr:DUF362 domain-containing protein [Clostridium homopropionicum]KOA19709.1 ferredoxin-2 [Clostridium homopropionicum DSM 5847]SFF79436.1 Uncharacterized conserved protein, DUF362 family [Clostridium homopropionicum]